MKTKVMVVLFTMLFALTMMAQTATQAAPAAGEKTSSCCNDKCPMAKDGKGCCEHDMANMKAGEKCPMMKDGKMANGKSCCGDGCCKDGKCAMASNKDGKGGCCGDKCPMMKKGDKSAAKSPSKDDCCKKTAEVSCCHAAAACCKGGYMPCCGRDKTAA